MKMNNRCVPVWCLITLVAFLSMPRCEGKNWAFIVGGYRSWYSYMYQADACHAYHVLSDHGVPDDQIVVMVYDDIAYNEKNPYPGNIIHTPDGPNVYEGVQLDYTGDVASVELFLAVLQGDKDRVYELTGDYGKVINSGPEDHVFVFLSSIGDKGFLLMPDESILYASELTEALQSMHDEKKFAKLVFYVSGNFAGALFHNYLPEDIDVYAATSATYEQLSPIDFWDSERNTFLATCFGDVWLKNCEEVDLRYETLQEQFEAIVEEWGGSTPSQYGDLSFNSLPVSEFIGNGNRLLGSGSRAPNTGSGSALPVGEMEIFILKHLLADPRLASRHGKFRAELEEKLWLQSQTNIFFSSLVRAAVLNEDVDSVLSTHSPIQQQSAYEYTVDHLMDVCPRLTPSVNKFVLGKMNAVANLCNRHSLGKVMAAVEVAADLSPLC